MQLADHFRELVDAFSDLMGKHIKLARVELEEDARAVGGEVARIVAFLPLLFVGYIMLSVALGLFLNRYIAAELAFLSVAALNLGIGGVGTFLAVRKLRARRVMNDSEAELQTTAMALRMKRQ